VLIVASDTPFLIQDTGSADKSVDYSREPPEKEVKEKVSRKTRKEENPDKLPADRSAEKAEKKEAEASKPLKPPREYPLGRYFDWMSRPNELGRLLSELFKWKNKQYPGREVVLLSGGPLFGTFGDVCDHELGLSIPVVITGPVCGKVTTPANWALCSTLANGRFSYVYKPPLDQCNFCAIDIDFKNPQKPAVDCQLITVPLAESIRFAARPTAAGALPLNPPALAPPPPLPPPTSDFNPGLYMNDSEGFAVDAPQSIQFGGDAPKSIQDLLR